MNESKTILIVDDEPDLRAMLARVLAQDGYQVVTAENGKEAVDLVTDRLPDLILMDLMMPVMNGVEATKQIRKLNEGHQLPVVAITAYDLRRLVLPEEEMQLWQAVLRKPIPVDILRTVVADLIRNRAHEKRNHGN